MAKRRSSFPPPRAKRVTHETSKKPLPKRASLMGLPIELRLEILKYCLPDLSTIPHRGSSRMRAREHAILEHIYPGLNPDSVVTSKDREKIGQVAGGPRLFRHKTNKWFQEQERHPQVDRPHWPLRHDGTGTDLCIMRANSKIYREAQEILYDRSFEIYIQGSTLEFFTHHTSLHNNLSPTSLLDDAGLSFRHMKSLEIVVESQCFHCSCEENLYYEYDCGAGLCFPQLKDSMTTLANLLSHWPSLEHLIIDIIDRTLEEEEVIEDQVKKYHDRLIQLMEPFHAIRGLKKANILWYSKDITWTPELKQHVGDLKRDMTSPGNARNRTDWPLEKMRLCNAIDLAKAMGVRSFRRPTFRELVVEFELEDEIKQFKLRMLAGLRARTRGKNREALDSDQACLRSSEDASGRSQDAIREPALR